MIHFTWEQLGTFPGSVLPDIYGEAAVAGHWVLVGAFQGDRGFGSTTHFTAEDHRLPKCTHHV